MICVFSTTYCDFNVAFFFCSHFFLFFPPGTQSRYTVLEQLGGVSILRIEPVRAGRDDAPYECVAENGVGDAVSADATLTVYEGKYNI